MRIQCDGSELCEALKTCGWTADTTLEPNREADIEYTEVLSFISCGQGEGCQRSQLVVEYQTM